MTMSDRGLRMLKNFEGCHLKAYKNPVGILTIGYGSTGPHVTPGKVITQAEADALLRQDLVRFEDAVARLVTMDLTQGQYDALVCFAFNVGIGALAGSTLLRMLNAGNLAGAAGQFSRWTKAKGQELPGLVKRRAAEAKRFREADDA